MSNRPRDPSLQERAQKVILLANALKECLGDGCDLSELDAPAEPPRKPQSSTQKLS